MTRITECEPPDVSKGLTQAVFIEVCVCLCVCAFVYMEGCLRIDYSKVDRLLTWRSRPMLRLGSELDFLIWTGSRGTCV